jgi:hypothetical protein
MGSHIVDGQFQSDKYPTCPAGKVPLSVKDKAAQDLLWEYAQRRRRIDPEFANDLETALRAAGFYPHLRSIRQITAPRVPEGRREVICPSCNGTGAGQMHPLLGVVEICKYCEATGVAPDPEGSEAKPAAPDGSTCP